MIDSTHRAGREPPSRFSNPFSTCWTRPGALAWQRVDGVAAAAVATRLLEIGAGQLVGPHGSGKSTLLREVALLVAQRGLSTACRTLGSDYRWRKRTPRPGGADVLFVDGAEQLNWPRRRWLVRRCRAAGASLLITTHTAAPGVETLADLSPTEAVALSLFDRLVAGRSTPVSRMQAVQAYRRCNRNLRDMWFELYDRHEQLVTLRRASRVASA